MCITGVPTTDLLRYQFRSQFVDGIFFLNISEACLSSLRININVIKDDFTKLLVKVYPIVDVPAFRIY